jgi:hypothetical protein
MQHSQGKYPQIMMFEGDLLRSYFKGLFDSSPFKRNLPLVGAGDVIRWWESRRFFFNAVVGCTGVITCVLLIICAVTADSIVGEPIGLPDGPLLGVFGIFFYGLLANLFYTGGWIGELLMRATTTAERSTAFGLKAFRVGVNFSIFITLCPAVICWVAFAVALMKAQKH